MTGEFRIFKIDAMKALSLSMSLGRRGMLAGSLGLLAAPAIVRAQGQNGVALVIGNSKYKWEASLPNVARDVSDVAKAFQALGLKTDLVQDAGLSTVSAAIERFKGGTQGASLAVVYYAGHGASWDNATYLVPADADLGDPRSVSSLVRVDSLKEATRGAAHRLLVFDNCRNNPAGGWRQRQLGNVSKVDASTIASALLNDPNTLVMFSTAPGRIALDGPPGGNSPFAAAFLRQMEASSVELQTLPDRLRRDLLLATECRQVLFDINSVQAPYSIAAGGRRTPARSAPVVDPGRIIELGNVYAFARAKGLLLPGGLVALRPPPGSPHVDKAGSYEFNWTQAIGNSKHLEPVAFIVLGINGNKVEFVNSSRRYNSFVSGAGWYATVAQAEASGIAWMSSGDAYKMELKWRTRDSGVFSSTINKALSGVGETQPFKRLDG